MEALFLIGSLIMAYRYKALPLLPKTTPRLLINALIIILVGLTIHYLAPHHHRARSIVG
ncbi:MAG: hypothetical protein H6766_07805 [Candidatus Peribacteria bacterium]|nr:MAG: hypothetical protein H6766_07805 [Candidatus Peribacteria bacterium]